MRSASVLMDKRETRNARESPVARIAATEEGGGAIKNLINNIFMRSLPVNGNVLRGQGMNK